MLTAGIISLVLSSILFIVIIWLIEERDLSDGGCIVLGSLLFILLLFGTIWLYSGAYEKGYHDGAMDAKNGKIIFEKTTEYKIIEKQ